MLPNVFFGATEPPPHTHTHTHTTKHHHHCIRKRATVQKTTYL